MTLIKTFFLFLIFVNHKNNLNSTLANVSMLCYIKKSCFCSNIKFLNKYCSIFDTNQKLTLSLSLLISFLINFLIESPSLVLVN